MPRYAELIYNGFWFSPEREMLQAAIDRARSMSKAGALKLYKGNVITTGPSPKSLYSEELSPSRTITAPTTRRTRRLHQAQRAAPAHARARHACPVGSAFAQGPQEGAFHMRSFFAAAV
jgi:argininosuccinate synthase